MVWGAPVREHTCPHLPVAVPGLGRPSHAVKTAGPRLDPSGTRAQTAEPGHVCQFRVRILTLQEQFVQPWASLSSYHVGPHQESRSACGVRGRGNNSPLCTAQASCHHPHEDTEGRGTIQLPCFAECSPSRGVTVRKRGGNPPAECPWLGGAGGQRGGASGSKPWGSGLTLQQLSVAPVLPAVLLTRAGGQAPSAAPDTTEGPCGRKRG